MYRDGADPHLVTWVVGLFTGRPHFVGLGHGSSLTVVYSNGAPQGTCMQKCFIDKSIVGCISGKGEEHLANDFKGHFGTIFLRHRTSKTKEMVIDSQRSRPHLQPGHLGGGDAEVVWTLKNLGLLPDD